MKASQVDRRRPAPRIVRLEPNDFAESFSTKPTGAIAVGLRLVSDNDESQARRDAQSCVESLYEEGAEHEAAEAERNDALMAFVVGASMCDPNDVTREPQGLPAIRDMIRTWLTSAAIRRLWFEFDALRAEAGQLAVEATDDDIGELIGLLQTTTISPRARRFLGAALVEIID